MMINEGAGKKLIGRNQRCRGCEGKFRRDKSGRDK